MKTPGKSLALHTLAGLVLAGLTVTAAEPKKVIVVTTTLGFRHSSIPTAEKVLGKLAQDSGAFTVEYIQQPSGRLNQPRKPDALKADADDAAKERHKAALAKWEVEEAKYREAEEAFNARLKQALEKLSPENLKNYHGVIFANTTGDLPVPDLPGFIAWVRQGGACIGMHSASDTFHGRPDFLQMLGGEFAGHGAQVGVDCLNLSPKHPTTAHLGTSWKIKQEEIYLFKNFDQSQCHELLALDKHPNQPDWAGHFSVSWCKQYGKGRVFYTSLGHREDIWDDTEPNRKNPPEVAKAYQQHILAGIKWALGLESGEARPQTAGF
jgi:type 1 glutamine amidotransferase